MILHLRKITIGALFTLALLATACSDWTDPKSLDIHYPSFEEMNPELYRQYMEDLRNYKAREHKVVIITINNSTSTPMKQNEHLTAYPDSVDYICLANPGDLHPALVEEFTSVREKGTRVVYNIDYEALETLWSQKIETEGAAADEDKFLLFIKEQTQAMLGLCDEFTYDGIVVSYLGNDISSASAEEKAVYEVRQRTFLSLVQEWKKNHKDNVLFFQGNPQNLSDKDLLSECIYIIVPQYDAVMAAELGRAIVQSSVEGVPTDRFIIGVTIPSISDPDSDAGYFSDYEDEEKKVRLTAVKGAAQWVLVLDKKYTKVGISIVNAQDDYFNSSFIYKNIRGAIGIMNYAPQK